MCHTSKSSRSTWLFVSSEWSPLYMTSCLQHVVMINDSFLFCEWSIGFSSHVSVEGTKTILRCNSSAWNLDTTVVFWYKGLSGSPLYTLDARTSFDRLLAAGVTASGQNNNDGGNSGGGSSSSSSSILHVDLDLDITGHNKKYTSGEMKTSSQTLRPSYYTPSKSTSVSHLASLTTGGSTLLFETPAGGTTGSGEVSSLYDLEISDGTSGNRVYVDRTSRIPSLVFDPLVEEDAADYRFVLRVFNDYYYCINTWCIIIEARVPEVSHSPNDYL